MRAMIVACGIVGAGLSLEAQSPLERSVTLTGCLERTFGGYAFVAVQQGAGVTPPDRPPAGVVAPVSKALGTVPPRSMHEWIVARSDGSVDLDQQVNRRIRVTGTIQELPSAGGRSNADPAVNGGLTVLTVTSAQTVSTTCPNPLPLLTTLSEP